MTFHDKKKYFTFSEEKKRELHNGHICKTKSNIRLTSKSFKALLLRSGTRQKCSPLKFLFSIIMEVPVKRIGERKKNMHQNR